MSISSLYQKNFSTSICQYGTIGLIEFNTGITYSGLTLVLDYTGFTSHFDTFEHQYKNIILNNDVYIYTGITGEIHYFTINDIYSGSTQYIDPRLDGLSESGVISGFTSNVLSCTNKLIYSGYCCPVQEVKSSLPWVCITIIGSGINNCTDYIQKRTSKGWTLDFIFNKNNVTDWSDNVFFYTGVRDEYQIENYADNNLSFKFTNDGKIRWSSYRYSGFCDSVSGYTPYYYVDSGETPTLCLSGTSNDFNITITFERNNIYTGCELTNEGGIYDLYVWGSGTTETLNSKWLSERKKRLGTLKIFHNGVLIYKLKNWEEIILSDRGDQPFTHVLGGGVTGSSGLHEGVCCYTIKNVSYFEEPLNFIEIQDKYLNHKSSYIINECSTPCENNLQRL